MSYVKFGTGTPVTGASVTRAMLKLPLDGKPVARMSVYPAAAGWSEKTVTAAKVPAITGTNAVTITPKATDTVLSFDVSKWVTKTGTYAFAIKSSATTAVTRLRSVEYGDATTGGPELDLTWTRPTPAPTPAHTTSPTTVPATSPTTAPATSPTTAPATQPATAPATPPTTAPATCTTGALLVPTCGVLWGAEWGMYHRLAYVTDKSAAFATVVPELKLHPKVKAIVYFDTPSDNEGDRNISVNSTAAGLAMFRTVAADPIFNVTLGR